MFGSINQLVVLQLVRPCGLDLPGHLLQSVHMGLGLVPARVGVGQASANGLNHQWTHGILGLFIELVSVFGRDWLLRTIRLSEKKHHMIQSGGYPSKSKDEQMK